MEVLPDGRIRCRVKITGSYNGEKWEYTDPESVEGSQFIHPPDEFGNVDCSRYWWEEGNMGCDCNRKEFLPDHLQSKISDDCGSTICIDEIIPVELGPNGETLPTLQLLESFA